MPARPDTLADFPQFFVAGDGHDVPDDLVSWDTGKGHRHDLAGANFIPVTNLVSVYASQERIKEILTSRIPHRQGPSQRSRRAEENSMER